MMKNQLKVKNEVLQFNPLLVVDNDHDALFVDVAAESIALDYLADASAVSMAIATRDKLELRVPKERFEAFNQDYLGFAGSELISVDVY